MACISKHHHRIRPLAVIASVLVCLLCAPAGAAGDSEPEVRLEGSVRNLVSYSDYYSGSERQALSMVRLRLSAKSSDRLSAEFAYELTPTLKDVEGTAGAFNAISLPRPYRALDLDRILYDGDDGSGDGFWVTQNLDRAFVTYSGSSFDLHVGRQPVSFGSAHAVNPTDVIAPFSYSTIAKEELAGVDAIRLKVPTGHMGELDAGVVLGDEARADESAAFIRSRGYYGGTDVAFMVMAFRDNVLLGADAVRSIGGAGSWVEAALTLAGGAADYRPEDNYARLSAGVDYIFKGGTYASLEYHYNGPGATGTEQGMSHLTGTAYTDGAVYLMCRNYLAPAATFEITPLMHFTAQALVNLDDGSALVAPGLEYNVSDDVYLGLGAYAGLGPGGDPSVAWVSGAPSEFGLYPDVYFASLNVYF
jgi:hypothetical protein